MTDKFVCVYMWISSEIKHVFHNQGEGNIKSLYDTMFKNDLQKKVFFGVLS